MSRWWTFDFACLLFFSLVTASSPRSDIADFYIFNSYEPNRAGFVTLLMNVNGLQVCTFVLKHPF